MNKKDEALKMAIEWTEGWYGYSPSKDAVLKACKEALKQPAQEPALELVNSQVVKSNIPANYTGNLYTHPHQWQGLTDDEINEILVNHDLNNVEMAGNHIDVVLLMNNVEQALKEKNHG